MLPGTRAVDERECARLAASRRQLLDRQEQRRIEAMREGAQAYRATRLGQRRLDERHEPRRTQVGPERRGVHLAQRVPVVGRRDGRVAVGAGRRAAHEAQRLTSP